MQMPSIYLVQVRFFKSSNRNDPDFMEKLFEFMEYQVR